MLIDFDWAGDEGRVVYPRDIKKDPILNLPGDVQLGGVILAKHDVLLVREL